MTDGADAYSIPACFEAELVSIYECWRARTRGDNDVPFSDDVNLPSPGSGADDAVLIDVFENPLRFRLALAGRSIAAQLGPERGGKFLDELEPEGLLDHLEAQCAATVRSRAPTYFRQSTAPAHNCTAPVGKRTDRDAPRRGSCYRRSLTVQPDSLHAAGAIRDRAKLTSGAHLEFHTREQMDPRRVPLC